MVRKRVINILLMSVEDIEKLAAVIIGFISNKIIGKEECNMAITFKENHAEYYGQYLTPPIEVIATVLDQNKIYTTKNIPFHWLIIIYYLRMVCL